MLLIKKRFPHIEERLAFTHKQTTANSNGKFSREIVTANSYGELPRQIAAANSHGKTPWQTAAANYNGKKATANNHYKHMRRSTNNVTFNTF